MPIWLWHGPVVTWNALLVSCSVEILLALMLVVAVLVVAWLAVAMLVAAMLAAAVLPKVNLVDKEEEPALHGVSANLL
jgi:hypothetical protein